MIPRNKIFPIIILLILLYVVYFSFLTLQTFRIWDETRQAFNAYEMTLDNDFIVSKYQGNPDMWNLKPPLLIWMQSSLMRIFGPWEFAVRFPSALAGFFTAMMIFIFIWRKYDRFWLG